MSTSSLSTSTDTTVWRNLPNSAAMVITAPRSPLLLRGPSGPCTLACCGPWRSGGFKNWDLAVHKDWHVKERYTAEFRAEAFNFSNRTNYYTPVIVLGDNGTFGESQQTPDVGKGVTVTGLGGPREVQLGLKMIW